VSLHHFSFHSPEYLAVLVLVPLLFVFAYAVRRRRPRYGVSLSNANLLVGLVARRRKRWWASASLILLALALSTASAALAQPHVQRIVTGKSTTVVLLVDISQSMEAHDIGQARLGVGETRLVATVTAMHDFIRQLTPGAKVGLITFSDRVQVLQTPTTDHALVDGLLNTLSPQGGTALGTGVEAAVKSVITSLAADGVFHTPGKNLPAAIVLESDGAQNRGVVSPAAAGAMAGAAGVPIYGISVGRRNGFIVQGKGYFAYQIPVPPDPGAVGLLARESGGKAFAAVTAPGLREIYRNLGASVAKQPETTEITSWFEAAAALFLVSGIGVARARGGALP
jgi:Ca-activated chloride channel homolog